MSPLAPAWPGGAVIEFRASATKRLDQGDSPCPRAEIDARRVNPAALHPTPQSPLLLIPPLVLGVFITEIPWIIVASSPF